MIIAVISGNLGNDAELRHLNEGTVVLSFGVASNQKVKGEKITTWVRCSLFGERAQKLAQYLTKGTKVTVSGTLSTREYEGKTYLELRVDQLEFMGGERHQDAPAKTQARPQPRSPMAQSIEADLDPNKPLPF